MNIQDLRRVEQLATLQQIVDAVTNVVEDGMKADVKISLAEAYELAVDGFLRDDDRRWRLTDAGA